MTTTVDCFSRVGCSPSVVLGPAALVSPGNLLDMQSLRIYYYRPTASDILGGGAEICDLISFPDDSDDAKV